MSPFERLIPRLPVADLDRTIAFYRDVLGFRPTVLWPDPARPSFAILERGRARVAFFDFEAPRHGRIGYAELYIRVPDAAALHARLARKCTIEWGPEVYGYGNREFGLRDPDGYLLIFTEPTQDPPTTHEP